VTLVARVASVVFVTLSVACAEGDRADGQAPSSDATGATSSPGDGHRVDVGGYELAYECRGEASPTIVTEAGYDSAGTTTWSGLLDDFAAISRVCAYDRAGTGTSDPRPDADGLTSADQASELHALLETASVEPPYVLVAHSYGGFIARLFADAHPEEAAGLVLIESSHEDEIDAYRRFYGDDPDGDWVDGGDLLDMSLTEDALRNARDYGDVPLVVIRAERYEDVLDEALWRDTQGDLATMSTNAIYVEALGSGHFVMEDDPDVVVAAVAAVVEAARSDTHLPPCEDFVATLRARCP
jgi:pimeloyl-ACP methyl ester carboxylesterase